MKLHWPLCWMMVISLHSLAQDQPQPGRAPLGQSIELVIVSADVVDKKHRPASGFDATDFTIYEDNQVQKLSHYSAEDTPAAVAILVDTSKSVARSQAAIVKAIDVFLQGSNPMDDFVLASFSDEPHLEQDYTRDHELITQAAMRSQRHGGTALYDAIAAANTHLEKAKWMRRVLVLITDGDDNESHIPMKQAILTAQQGNGTAIFALGIGSEARGRTTLEKITKATGGVALFPRRENEVEDAAQQLAREIREQFYVGYKPTNQLSNGGCRKLNVVAHSSGKEVAIRTAAQYCVPKAQAPKR